MTTPAADFKLVKAGLLIDGRNGQSIENGAVLVQGSQISRVGPAADISVPEGASFEQYDYPADTLLPGLIDAHAHLNYSGNGMHTDDVMNLSDDILLMRSIVNARKHMEAGVTTIRECGAKHYTTFSLREGIRQGLAVGPRMLLCGRPITITGGHMYPMGTEADGVDAVRVAVRELVKDGADWIKVAASGGSTSTSQANRPSYSLEELRAIVDEAHNLGKQVGTHSIAAQSVVNSLDADVDLIIHCGMLEADGTSKFREDIAERIAREGKGVNSTLHIGRARLRMLEEMVEGGDPSPRVPWGRRTLTLDSIKRDVEESFENVRRLDMAGVQQVPGSDAGFGWYPLGRFVDELECLVLAGLSPTKVLLAATRDSAKAFGISQVTGTLEGGKSADLLVVNGDPTQGIMALENVVAVFSEGVKVK